VFKSDRFELLSTRLLVTRHGLAEFLSREPANNALLPNPVDWARLNDAFGKSRRIADATMADHWRLISSKDEISASERWLLRSTGKSYDGVVSRHLNRPMSRLVSRFILHSPITPNQWTLLILLLAVAAFAFLSRGTYLGFVIGAIFYQLHSILDGCDGEIARIKYLDSKRGPGIDALGDLIALLLFVAGLTVGLFHYANGGVRWLFLAEGAVAFVLIALRLGRHTRELLSRGMDAVRSSEHGELLRESGEHYFGRTLHRFAIAMTGRDVVFLLFLVLALAGIAPVIMHLLFAYSLGAVLLLLKGHSMRSARQVRPVLP
jgi:phosphatidylglycerophosphate synthase